MEKSFRERLRIKPQAIEVEGDGRPPTGKESAPRVKMG